MFDLLFLVTKKRGLWEGTKARSQRSEVGVSEKDLKSFFNRETREKRERVYL